MRGREVEMGSGRVWLDGVLCGSNYVDPAW